MNTIFNLPHRAEYLKYTLPRRMVERFCRNEGVGLPSVQLLTFRETKAKYRIETSFIDYSKRLIVIAIDEQWDAKKQWAWATMATVHECAHDTFDFAPRNLDIETMAQADLLNVLRDCKNEQRVLLEDRWSGTLLKRGRGYVLDETRADYRVPAASDYLYGEARNLVLISHTVCMAKYTRVLKLLHQNKIDSKALWNEIEKEGFAPSAKLEPLWKESAFPLVARMWREKNNWVLREMMDEFMAMFPPPLNFQEPQTKAEIGGHRGNAPEQSTNGDEAGEEQSRAQSSSGTGEKGEGDPPRARASQSAKSEDSAETSRTSEPPPPSAQNPKAEQVGEADADQNPAAGDGGADEESSGDGNSESGQSDAAGAGEAETTDDDSGDGVGEDGSNDGGADAENQENDPDDSGAGDPSEKDGAPDGDGETDADGGGAKNTADETEADETGAEPPSGEEAAANAESEENTESADAADAAGKPSAEDAPSGESSGGGTGESGDAGESAAADQNGSGGASGDAQSAEAPDSRTKADSRSADATDGSKPDGNRRATAPEDEADQSAPHPAEEPADYAPIYSDDETPSDLREEADADAETGAEVLEQEIRDELDDANREARPFIEGMLPGDGPDLVTPARPDAWIQAAAPFVPAMARELKVTLQPRVLEESRQGRLNVGRIVRFPDTDNPFDARHALEMDAGRGKDLTLLLDTSGSMRDGGKIQAAKVAGMTTHLMGRQVDMYYRILTSRTLRVLASSDLPEAVCLGLIAGLSPHTDGDNYLATLPLLLEELRRNQATADQIVVVVTDGQPGGGAVLSEMIRAYRDEGFLIVGLGLNLSSREQAGMEAIFSADFTVHGEVGSNRPGGSFAEVLGQTLTRLVRMSQNR